MFVRKILKIQSVSKFIQHKFNPPAKVSEHMFNSLTPFVVRVQKDCYDYMKNSDSNIRSFSIGFRPKNGRKPKHFQMIDVTEGMFTQGPKCDYVQIADGRNSISINMNSGAIDYSIKPNPLLPASTFMKRMQNVIDKFQAN